MLFFILFIGRKPDFRSTSVASCQCLSLMCEPQRQPTLAVVLMGVVRCLLFVLFSFVVCRLSRCARAFHLPRRAKMQDAQCRGVQVLVPACLSFCLSVCVAATRRKRTVAGFNPQPFPTLITDNITTWHNMTLHTITEHTPLVFRSVSSSLPALSLATPCLRGYIFVCICICV